MSVHDFSISLDFHDNTIFHIMWHVNYVVGEKGDGMILRKQYLLDRFVYVENL
jgi:hypothetical protein